MSSSARNFQFRNPVLLIALAAAFPVITYAAADANVNFTVGSVVAVNASGVQRPLTKGAEVGNGDTIRTGDGGRAQMRFSDGAMVSLQPQTEFRIDNYQYAGKADGEEKGFFSLLKGGLRTITGLVGRSNRDNYKVSTSVATIGIRGTEYSAGLNPSGDELNVATGEGLVEVCNAAGCVLLAGGESGLVQGTSVPRRTDARPLLPPATFPGDVQPVYSSNEQVGTDGLPSEQIFARNSYAAIVPPALPPVTPPVVPPVTPPVTPPVPPPVLYTVGGIVGVSGAVYNSNATAVFNGDGSLNSFTSGSLTSSQGTALVMDSGVADSILKWGRWASGTATIDNVSSPIATDQGFHHFWGAPTVTLPSSGVVSYVLLGGTSPTEATGSWASGTLNSAALSVNFGTLAVSASVSIDINPTSTNRTYNMSGTGSLSAGNGFSIVGMTGSGSACLGGTSCSGDVTGKFFGTVAERVGLTYKIQDNNFTKNVIGVVVLKQ